MKKLFLLLLILCLLPLNAEAAITTTSGLTQSGGGTPGGSSGQIQYNNSGSFGGLSNTTASQTALLSLIGTPPYYAMNYGATCDGKTLTDVSTTSSSAVISSAGYTFVAGDAGKQITIGAGSNVTTTGTDAVGSYDLTSVGTVTGIVPGDYIYGTGVPQGSRVAAVNGSTVSMNKVATSANSGTSLVFAHVVNTTILSVAGGNATLNTTLGTTHATTTLTTFGTSDDTGLAAAVTAASNAGGGLIALPSNSMCIVTTSLVLPTKVSITGYGWGPSGSIIKWIQASDQTDGVIAGQNNAATGATCTQALAGNQVDNQLSNFEIDDDAALQSSFNVSGKGIRLQCTVRSVVHHMYVHGTPASGICTDYGYPTAITNSLIVDAGRMIPLAGSGGGGNGIGEGMTSNKGEGYILNDNTVINPGHFGIFVESETATTAQGYVNMSGNVVEGGPASGTGTTESAGIGNSGALGATITGNRVSNYYSNSTWPWGGIFVDNGTVSSNASGVQTVISGNDIDTVYHGIKINYNAATPSGSLVAKVVVSGNVINNVGHNGIYVLPKSTGTLMDSLVITGNLISLAGDAGIYMFNGAGGTVKNLVINDNIISNNGATTATDGLKSGITLGAPTITGVNIQGNVIEDTGPATQKYGITVLTGSTVTKALITENRFDGNTTNSYNPVGTISGFVWGNLGADKFTITGCSSTTTVGSGTEGSYASGTSGACATVLTLNGNSNITAPNGWACSASDTTTALDIIQGQSASTTSSCTISGTTVSGDVIIFQARPF